MTTAKKNRRRRQSEGSFTLIEVVIALAIVTFVIIGVSSVQGNSIVFADYGRNVTQATWLARRVMSQVDYYWKTKPFKDLETEVRETKFEDFPEYSYSLTIKEWKFPFEKMLTMAMGGGIGADEEAKDEAEDKQDDAGGGMSQMIETISKQVFGDEPKFLTAFVEVSWSEGAARNQSSMTYLLTNQAKIDEAIVQLKPVYDKLTKPPPAKNDPKKRPPRPGDPNNPDAGGADGGSDGAPPPDTGDSQ